MEAERQSETARRDRIDLYARIDFGDFLTFAQFMTENDNRIVSLSLHQLMLFSVSLSFLPSRLHVDFLLYSAAATSALGIRKRKSQENFVLCNASHRLCVYARART